MEPTLIESWSLRSSVQVQLALHPSLVPSPNGSEQGWTSNWLFFAPVTFRSVYRHFAEGPEGPSVKKKKDEGNVDLRDNRQYSLAAFCIIKGEPCEIMTASVPWLVKEFPFLFQSKSCCFCCFCCCYLNTGKTARIVLVVIWCHDSSGPVHANRLHTKMRTQLCMNT